MESFIHLSAIIFQSYVHNIKTKKSTFKILNIKFRCKYYHIHILEFFNVKFKKNVLKSYFDL